MEVAVVGIATATGIQKRAGDTGTVTRTARGTRGESPHPAFCSKGNIGGEDTADNQTHPGAADMMIEINETGASAVIVIATANVNAIEGTAIVTESETGATGTGTGSTSESILGLITVSW